MLCVEYFQLYCRCQVTSSNWWTIRCQMWIFARWPCCCLGRCDWFWWLGQVRIRWCKMRTSQNPVMQNEGRMTRIREIMWRTCQFESLPLSVVLVWVQIANPNLKHILLLMICKVSEKLKSVTPKGPGELVNKEQKLNAVFDNVLCIETFRVRWRLRVSSVFGITWTLFCSWDSTS